MINPWWEAGKAAMVAFAFGGAVYTGYEWGESSERAVWERKQAEAQRAAKEQAEQNAEETARRFAAQQAIINEVLREKENARLDADRAAAAGERLRKQIATLAASCVSPGDPGAIGSGEAADAPGDLLADVLGRVDVVAGELARYADEARAAGLACERSYDALTR